MWMNAELERQVELLFQELADKPPAQRERALNERCAPTPELRERVQRQQALHNSSCDPGLRTPVFGRETPATAQSLPLPRYVGPYEILKLLGEGGMGMVYLAEQKQPIRRRVALKVIKLGMDTQAVMARFEAERDRRNQRRALTEEELLRLLKVARMRPLAEYGREISRKDADSKRSRRSRATWKREPLTIDNLDEAVGRARKAMKDNPDLIAHLERTGQERALMYKMLVLTGLRKGELASLTAGQLDFVGSVAHVTLNPADEKNRQGSSIPLRADLAVELSAWLDERLGDLRAECRRRRQPIPALLPASTPLFHVPSGLTRIFDRDLAAAGISKRDERNRVVDVHALRATFGTHLCAAGVPLRTAQAAMRHSKPELTANIYTDPKLLDVAGAIAALPALTLPPKNAESPIEVAS